MIIQKVKPIEFRIVESDEPPAPFEKRSFQFRFELSSSAPRHQFIRIHLFATYSCYIAEYKQRADFSADISFISSSHIRYFERKEGAHLRQLLALAYEKAANKLAALLEEQHGERVVPFLAVLSKDEAHIGNLLERAADEAVLLYKEEEEDHGRYI